MKRPIIIIPFHPFPTFASTVRVETLHSQDKYPTEGTYPVLFRLKISKPWYIHGTKSEGEGLIATRLSFQEFPGVKIGETKFPAPQKKKFPYTSKPIEIYAGSILVKATLAVSGAVPLGNPPLHHYRPPRHTNQGPEPRDISFRIYGDAC
jgi:hypothetical protein